MNSGLDPETQAICDKILAVCFAPPARYRWPAYDPGPPVDPERWAQIHRHRFSPWAPGSKCRNCGRDETERVHAPEAIR
jgi:hypothetical protein